MTALLKILEIFLYRCGALQGGQSEEFQTLADARVGAGVRQGLCETLFENFVDAAEGYDPERVKLWAVSVRRKTQGETRGDGFVEANMLASYGIVELSREIAKGRLCARMISHRVLLEVRRLKIHKSWIVLLYSSQGMEGVSQGLLIWGRQPRPPA
jgi:hypothetical protein